MRWVRSRVLRRPAPTMDARWGTDDCWTWAFGDAPRPAVLCAADEHDAFAQAVRCYGGIDEMIVGIAEWMPGWIRVGSAQDMMPGDVVMGATAQSPFVLARVGASYLPVERTNHGYAVASFVRVFAVYRRNGRCLK